MLGIKTFIFTIGAGDVWNSAVEQGSLMMTLKFEAILYESAVMAAVNVYE